MKKDPDPNSTDPAEIEGTPKTVKLDYQTDTSLRGVDILDHLYSSRHPTPSNATTATGLIKGGARARVGAVEKGGVHPGIRLDC
jgi:hypothetical protein